jgi:NifU-like protein involved in Fe-S cluster formation
MVYNTEVLVYFQKASLLPLWDHQEVGILSSLYQDGASSIHFQTQMISDRVDACRYKVKGCAFTIALCIWLSDQLTGRNRTEIPKITMAEMSEWFKIPEARMRAVYAVYQIYNELVQKIEFSNMMFE